MAHDGEAVGQLAEGVARMVLPGVKKLLLRLLGTLAVARDPLPDFSCETIGSVDIALKTGRHPPHSRTNVALPVLPLISELATLASCFYLSTESKGVRLSQRAEAGPVDPSNEHNCRCLIAEPSACLRVELSYIYRHRFC